jgi:hypothetical protein
VETRIELDGSGRFRSDAIRAGVHDIQVVVLGASRPVLTVPRVVVKGAAPTEDPRLAEIDLRGRLTRITLAVRDPDGGIPPGARLMLRDGDRWPDVPVNARGEAHVWTGPLGLEAEARAPGFRRLHVTGVVADRTLTLPRGIPVRLRYGGTEALPPRAAVLVRVMLEDEQPGHDIGARWPDPRTHVVAHPRDTVRTALSLPGRYTVEVSLRDRRKGRTARELAATTPHVILTEVEIAVQGGTAPQTFSIRVDRGAMLEGIAEFNEAVRDE